MSYVGTHNVDTRNGTADRPFVFGFNADDVFNLTQTAFVAAGYLVSIYGGDDNDTIGNTNSGGANSQVYVDGGAGNDIISGTELNDGFRDDTGNDSVDGRGGTDTAVVPYSIGFGGTVDFTASGTAPSLALNGVGGNDTFANVELFFLTDGRTLTATQLLALASVPVDELPGTTATTGTINTLQPRFGRVGGTAGDQDWYSASLTAGVQYTILLYGASLQDSYLRLLNSAGTQIAFDDDSGFSGGNFNARLLYTPGTNQSVLLSAQGHGANNGTYELAIFANQVGSLLFTTGNNNVGLTSGGYSWDTLAGDDVVTGSAFADRVLGGSGYDGLYGGGGDDFLHGGANEDIIAGDAGNDVLEGNDGGDVLSELAAGANSGNDLFYGGSGVDIMYAAAGNDFVYGGADSSNNFADLGAGNDAFFGAEGTDVVVGGSGDDEIWGNGGDDSLYGEADNDLIFGGFGIDLLSGAGGDDQLFGGAGNDLLIGDEGNDLLDGGAGIDILYGGIGDDILRGGAGSDVNAYYGGGGNDIFQVGAGFGATEYIYDFQPGDRIAFSTGHFSQVGAGAPEGKGLLENYSFSGGNSTIRVYTASAFGPGTFMQYTQTSTVVVVGVDIGLLAATAFDVNGIF